MIPHPVLVCPRCRQSAPEGGISVHPLKPVGQEGQSLLHTEVLECSNSSCRARYPVIDGIPVIFQDPRAIDLTLGPPFDVLSLGAERLLALVNGQHPSSGLYALLARISRYVWAGFHDWLGQEWAYPGLSSWVHSVEVVRWLTEVAKKRPSPPPSSNPWHLCLGAAVGREAWEMTLGPTLIVDAHLPSLLAGARLEREGKLELVAPLEVQRWGRMHLEAPAAPQVPVLRVCCDVLNPPFLAEAFPSVMACNLIDSVSDPFVAIGQSCALLEPSGLLLLTSPFAWREEVTPRDRWLENLSSHPDTTNEAVLLSLMEHNFPSSRTLLDRREFPWLLRSNAREVMGYQSIGWCWG